MITSKLTSKSQTTVPRPVRTALQLQPGDDVCYVIDGDRVILTKARRPAAHDDPFAEFHEWGSDADRRAYRDL